MTEDRPHPSHEEVGKLAEVICAAVADGPELERVAVAHVVLNRARQAQLHRVQMGCCHPIFGDGSIGQACDNLHWSDGAAPREPGFVPPEFSQRIYCRAWVAACQALARDSGDPTSGATVFHRHDDDPAWAGTRSATALIGRHLFYSA